MTDYVLGIHTMGQGGTRGVQGSARGRIVAQGVSGLPPAPKKGKNSKIMVPNHGLKYPKCVVTQKGWYFLISEAFGAIWMHYNRDI